MHGGFRRRSVPEAAYLIINAVHVSWFNEACFMSRLHSVMLSQDF